jgi:four helix bundle protein
MPFMFEKLEVYQRAVDFADEIASLPEDFTRLRLSRRPLNRTALSIATNLGEGSGHFNKPDRRTYFTIARGATQECAPPFGIALLRDLMKNATSIDLKEQFEVIVRMISGLIYGRDKRDR